jgi:hypothetical protein
MNGAARKSLPPASEQIAAVEAALMDYAEKRDSGTVPILPLLQRRVEALRHIQHVGAWGAGGFVSVHHKYLLPGAKRIVMPGSAHQSAESAVDDAFYWAEGRREGGCDVYLSMGAQKTAGGHGGRYPKAIRKDWNTAYAIALYLDIDVKDGGYATTMKAALALLEFIQATGLMPTMIVGSGTGGLHVYWRLGALVDPQQFRRLAGELVGIATEHGLMFDAQCTSDLVRLLRIPGTWNFKPDKDHPPDGPVTGRPVTLVYEQGGQQ